MARKKKTTFAKAQASLSRALTDIEKTVVGMVRSAPAKKTKKAKKKKAKAKAKSRK